MPDSYSAAEAARLLGVSERRVRQLIAEGRLPAERTAAGRLRLPQAVVHAARRDRGSASGSSSGNALDVEALASAVATAVTAALGQQLALSRQAESQATSAFLEERAARLAAEAEAAELRARLAEAVEATGSAAGRKWRRRFRRAPEAVSANASAPTTGSKAPSVRLVRGGGRSARWRRGRARRRRSVHLQPPWPPPRSGPLRGAEP